MTPYVFSFNASVAEQPKRKLSAERNLVEPRKHWKNTSSCSNSGGGKAGATDQAKSEEKLADDLDVGDGETNLQCDSHDYCSRVDSLKTCLAEQGTIVSSR